MRPHDDPNREERLKRALFGPDESDIGSGREPELDADMKRDLDDLRELGRRLESSGRAELERLSSELADPQLERDARAALDRLLGEPSAAPVPTAPPPRSLRPLLRVWPWLAAAALLALALGWTLWHFGQTTPPRPGPGVDLGSPDLALVDPVGAVQRYDSFQWSGAFPAGTRFELRIWSAEADLLAPPLVQETCSEPRWTPSDPSALPTALRWEVTARSASGELLGRRAASASLYGH